MCLNNGVVPPNESSTIGYCFQVKIKEKEQEPVYTGVFHGDMRYQLNESAVTDTVTTFNTSCGFYGYFSEKDARIFIDDYLYEELDHDLGDDTTQIVLVEACFDDIVEIGTPHTFGFTTENDVSAFRSKRRKILREVDDLSTHRSNFSREEHETRRNYF